MKILALKINKFNTNNLLKGVVIGFTFFLLFYSNSNIKAVNKALNLFLNKVFPSLFPFFIAIDLLSHTDVITMLNHLLSPFMNKVFNVSGSGSFPFIMGLISGYPTGAKIISNFRKNNICSKNDCEKLLAYTNNSGPLFILGTVGSGFFLSNEIGYLLLITHILASITVGIIFRNYRSTNNRSVENTVTELSFNNFSAILSNSIFSSLKTCGMILGFIIFFALIINILLTSRILHIFNFLPFSDWITGCLISSLEITNGLNFISSISCKNISLNLIFSAFFLGYGGLSVLLQVYSIISETDLSIKPYVVGKFLHGLIASFYTFVLISFLPFFHFTL